MEKVYLETSVVSYLVARRSRDLIVAGRQQLTIDWWDQEREKFELYVSEAVLQEAQAGDSGEIAKRSAIVSGLSVLTSTAGSRTADTIAVKDRPITNQGCH